ncbi:hypothetical protein AB395_0000586 [Sinorhizobium fredii CCBAU 45436]|nr:hypothetical protein SF83666_c05630 [Sinorhizobium fredii CCBAU 83666]AWI56266.1 hypothetical protein AB395_0000586 [Sinorhizobium fredii CCBAU 45436]
MEPSGLGWEATRRNAPPGEVTHALLAAWDGIGKKIAARRLAFARR